MTRWTWEDFIKEKITLSLSVEIQEMVDELRKRLELIEPFSRMTYDEREKLLDEIVKQGKGKEDIYGQTMEETVFVKQFRNTLVRYREQLKQEFTNLMISEYYRKDGEKNDDLMYLIKN